MFQMCMGDGLPAQVCCQCVHQINTSYSFKLQCEASDVTLRKLLVHQETQPDIKVNNVSRTDSPIVKFVVFTALTMQITVF